MAAKLQCEICGGKLVGKPGGIFECDSCGTEYSTEWAKAKIQEITGTVKVDGTVEVTGKVQVENGGPTALSLIKRGIQTLEDRNWREAESIFNRALEIDPESGDAFWGLYLCKKEWGSMREALQQVSDCVVLEDDRGYFRRARQYAKGQLAGHIARLEQLWRQEDQSELLPEEMRQDFVVLKGVLWFVGEPDRRKTIRTVKIPYGVTEIGRGAFCGFDGLKEVTIPESVKRIGPSAFKNCRELSSLVIPDSVTFIEPYTFDGCRKLTLYGNAGSYAEQFAKTNWLLFSTLKTQEEILAEQAAKKAEAKRKAERRAKREELNEEKDRLQAEILTLKGLFAGRRRKEIEARFQQINAELKELE
ncbi:MAG: leucine-rich repeat domain-containing protein [Eubacteriales bacterium]|nr:leucine-rich repeat domain-containing protein [Eubacteriales bacterium]